MFKITLQKDNLCIDMQKDIGLGLLEACYRADIYKQHNPAAIFTVVNMNNGDIEYQV